MNHIMLDLETWGTRPGCAIRSIGACLFDPNGKAGFGTSFYRNVTRESCEAAGLGVDPDTAKWWGEQSYEARFALEKDQVSLGDAIVSFDTWFKSIGAEFVWAHGAAFDPPILEAAWAALSYRPPWDYRAPRDTRTLYMLAKFNDKSVASLGTAHNALHDAWHQAACVQAAVRQLGVVL